MSKDPLRIALVGCGNIAEPYARDLVTYPELQLIGVTDLVAERAAALADKYGCRAYASLDDLLADPAVDLVINLAIHHAHYEINKRIIAAGKHVHSEKPLAMTHAEAQELVSLAVTQGVRLSASPFTLMGEAQQTAWKWVREGKLGAVRLVYAEVNWGRIETWHPAPQPFYEVGALFDVGVYPLAILTGIFGPARRVTASGHMLLPTRVTKTGEPFRIVIPDFVLAAIELANGTLVRLTTNFYVTQKGKQAGIEFHGDAASLHLGSWHMFNADVEVATWGQPYEKAPLVREPPYGVRWGRIAQDLAETIQQGRPPSGRASGEQAAHIVEILEATTRSMSTHQPVEIHSTFPPPEPMDWAR